MPMGDHWQEEIVNLVFAHDFDLLSNYQRLVEGVLANLGRGKYFSSVMMPTNEEEMLVKC